MKKLPPFVFIAPNKSEPDMGSGFILSTKQPYYLGAIIKVPNNPFAILAYVNENKPLVHAEVHGHSILITFAGNLSGYKVQVTDHNWEKELQKIYSDMADWFYNEKVLSNPNYYKRFKLYEDGK